jgi:hypothetical protein
MKHTIPSARTPGSGTTQSIEPTGETTKNRVLRRLKLALIENERADRGYNPLRCRRLLSRRRLEVEAETRVTAFISANTPRW